MDLDAILQSFDEEIAILQQVRALLTDDKAPLPSRQTPKRRKVSAEARAKDGCCTKGQMGEIYLDLPALGAIPAVSLH